MYTVQFYYDDELVKASCKDINCYAETDELLITLMDDDMVLTEDHVMYEELSELANEKLFERRYHNELEF